MAGPIADHEVAGLEHLHAGEKIQQQPGRPGLAAEFAQQLAGAVEFFDGGAVAVGHQQILVGKFQHLIVVARGGQGQVAQDGAVQVGFDDLAGIALHGAEEQGAAR